MTAMELGGVVWHRNKTDVWTFPPPTWTLARHLLQQVQNCCQNKLVNWKQTFENCEACVFVQVGCAWKFSAGSASPPGADTAHWSPDWWSGPWQQTTTPNRIHNTVRSACNCESPANTSRTKQPREETAKQDRPMKLTGKFTFCFVSLLARFSNLHSFSQDFFPKFRFLRQVPWRTRTRRSCGRGRCPAEDWTPCGPVWTARLKSRWSAPKDKRKLPYVKARSDTDASFLSLAF